MNAEHGRALIEELLKPDARTHRPALERLNFADADVTEELLARAARKLRRAERDVTDFPEEVVADAHAVVRLAFTAFLNQQGLRAVNGEGKHATTVEVVAAQLFPNSPGVRSRLQQLRHARNEGEYGTQATEVSCEQATEAAKFAGAMLQVVSMRIASGDVHIWH